MKKHIVLVIICLAITSCGQENKNVSFFKNTEAYDLAIAVENDDLQEIENIVAKKPILMDLSNPISGSNVLGLSLFIENYSSFKKLLELGANPNFINPFTKRSILMDACKFYTKPKPYTVDLRYVKLLIENKANVNYTIENDFIDIKGNHHIATSPLIEASKLDLEMVKMLIKSGANPYKKLQQNQSSPFSSSLQGFKNRFEIINYYIDSLKVEIKEPLYVGKKSTMFIQDFIKKYFSYEVGTEGYINTQTLIKKLEDKGLVFQN
jgi:hypothetical protein